METQTQTHFGALVTYTTAVNYQGVLNYLNAYGHRVPPNLGVEATKAYVSQVIAENGDQALEDFLQLHPEADDFAINSENSQPVVSIMQSPNIPTEKYWNEKRIKISVIISLMIGLTVLLALKFD
ncbi:hypothetical protein BKI52_33070 [marine bacterium AO1-C]|nr:hypothetical protein BKI52_33070 [marine bacterium AO1-C]